MERYDEYKNSGVEWIGEIPSGWEVRRSRRAVSTHRCIREGDGLVQRGPHRCEGALLDVGRATGCGWSFFAILNECGDRPLQNGRDFRC